ncbi:MAG: hypothetical protein ACK4RF_09820 [Cyclobacteriaceae bacterium]
MLPLIQWKDKEYVRDKSIIASMRKTFFRLLASLNKVVLPRYSKKDISRLSKTGKLIVAFRYWVTINSLD